MNDVMVELPRSGELVSPTQFARQLGLVCKLLAPLPEGAQWIFLTTPKASLAGAAPMQALAEGRYDEVKVSAEGYADR